MEIFITGLHIALCLFLILIVLLQPGKGADFGAGLGGGGGAAVFGAAGSVSLLGKMTGAVAALFMVTSMLLAYFANKPVDSVFDDYEESSETAPDPSTAGAEAAATPAGGSEPANTTPGEDSGPAPSATPTAPAPTEGGDAAPSAE